MTAKKRMANIELLRAISMLMVVTLHFLSRGGLHNAAEPLSASWVLVNVWDALAIISVNVYVLISGYFLIHSKFKLQKLFDIIIQVSTYSIFFYVLSIILGWNAFSVVGIGKALFPLLTSQYWFASVYVGLYCIFPFINKCLLSLSKKQHGILCVVLLAFSVFYFPSDALKIGTYSLAWMVTLYVVAGYIRLHYTPTMKINKNLLCLYLVPTIMLPLSKIFISLVGKYLFSPLIKFNGFFYKNNSIPVFFSALGLFLIFLNIDIKNDKLAKFLCNTGAVTFGVYLIHNNPSIREKFWGFMDLPRFLEKWWFLFWGVLLILLIFIVSGVVEWVRKLLYQKFLASKFYKCCIRKISSLRICKHFIKVE